MAKSAGLWYAKSIMDYLARWLELRFLSDTQLDLFRRGGELWRHRPWRQRMDWRRSMPWETHRSAGIAAR